MKLIKHGYLLIGLIVLILLGGYTLTSLHYRNNFLPHTTVAGINISGKSIKGANQTLLKQVKQRQYTLKDGTKTLVTFTGKEAGLSHNFKPILKQVKAKQNAWTWLTHALTKQSTTSTDAAVILDSKVFNQFTTQTVTTLNKTRTASKDAAIDFTKTDLPITKEQYGNTFDTAKVQSLIAKKISQGKTTINLKPAYQIPTLTKSSTKLKRLKQTLQKVSTEKITYNVNGNQFEIPKATLQSWLTYQDNQVTVDKAAVSQYVYSLKTKYDTYDKSLTFKSTKEGTVTVPAGIYGWSISASAEISALMTEIPKGKNFTRTAVVQGSGMAQKTRSVGTTYIEIDKKAQHMWLYQNGKVTISTDIVTAKPPQTTPSGVWSVWKKERNATLRGENSDGSNYASPVSYWMPIDETGVGIHDSSWQTQYGGTWYKEHGSHGCINTPPTVMAKLYNAVSAGIPVVVF